MWENHTYTTPNPKRAPANRKLFLTMSDGMGAIQNLIMDRVDIT